MKKILLTIAAVAASLSVFAQENGGVKIRNNNFYIEAGLSVSAYDRTIWMVEDPENPDFVRNSEIVDYSSHDSDESYMSRAIILPTVNLALGYKRQDFFLGFFLNTYMSYANKYFWGGPAPLSENEFVFHITPELRGYWMDKDNMRMYSGIAAGIRILSFSETLDGDTLGYGKTGFTYEIIPLGFSAGEKFTLGAEFGYGRPYLGVRFSIGYRF